MHRMACIEMSIKVTLARYKVHTIKVTLARYKVHTIWGTAIAAIEPKLR
jgi:hypothetical protein